MLNVLHLISPIPVSVNHYLAYRCVMQRGRPMAVSYCTKEAKEYKKSFSRYVASQVVEQNWRIRPNSYQHFYMDTTFYFPRVDMDCQNYYKIMTDAITDTQMVWLDDNVVCERTQRIFYDANNPHVEIDIYPVNYIGIFDTQDALDDFVDRCKNCAKYERNCRILNKAKEGRIQEEIADGVCAKYKEIKDHERTSVN